MREHLLKPNIKSGIIIISISMLVFVGCKKEFLNITPNHYLTEGNFYKTQDDFNQAVIAVYGDMQKFILSAHFLEEGITDNTTYDNHLDQGALGGTSQWGFMDQFKMTSDATLVSNAWTLIYTSIKDCNVPLSYLKTANIDQTLSEQFEGELRFFRAYFNFVAVRYWGDVPLLLNPVTTADQAFAITRSPVEDIYNAIIQDALYANSVLPASYSSANDKGRVTSGAAKMLLAEVYMTRHEYAKAENELRDIVNSTQYELLLNYADIFNPANKNNAESIFEVQFKEGEEGESSNFMYQFAPVGSRGTVILGPESGNSDGQNIPTLDMVQDYEPNDLRKGISIGFIKRGADTVNYVKKYDHDTDPNFARTPDNWPVYRYADVLLLLAEAINEQGYQTEGPFDLLKMIRDRAGLGLLTPVDLPDQEAFRKALAHERRVELAFENHRWFDLLRTGKAIEGMTAYGKKEMAHPTMTPPSFLPFDSKSYVINTDKLLYPIPSNELDINPNMIQNSGY